MLRVARVVLSLPKCSSLLSKKSSSRRMVSPIFRIYLPIPRMWISCLSATPRGWSIYDLASLKRYITLCGSPDGHLPELLLIHRSRVLTNSDVFCKLKALHSTLPWSTIRRTLSLSSKSSSLRNALSNLLLARPLGSRSLLQK